MELHSPPALLARADRFVVDGEALCRQQAELVARWRALGRETAEVEAVLVRLELVATEMRLYRARLEAELRKAACQHERQR